MDTKTKSLFYNHVDIVEDVAVITNPENRLIVGSNTIRLGTRFIRWATIFNWILVYVIFKMVRFFKR